MQSSAKWMEAKQRVMNGDKRRDVIFDIVVKSYIETAEPVGSQTISRRSGIGLSPASIRNIMADLEDQGLLHQPHTSAGRVPTDKGYRYWVDTLMQPEELEKSKKAWVQHELSSARTIEALAERVSKIISALTGNAAVIYVKNLKRVSFLSYLLDELIEAQRISEFLEEEPEIFVEGLFRVFEQPEFSDQRKMIRLLQAFDDKDHFVEILSEDMDADGIQVYIGSESGFDELGPVSLVVKDWYLGRTPIGGVAVVGPTRMRYPRVVSAVDFVARSASEAVSRF